MIARGINVKRFLRSYIVEKIGCQPTVTSQNPKIRQLLVDTDQRLAQEKGLAVTVESDLPRHQKAQEFDDEFQVIWREHSRQDQEVSVGRVNASLKTVFAFYRWAEEAGPRRAELLRLCKSHMLTDDRLAALIERDEPWLLIVKRKGGASKPLHAPVDLIIRTLDYFQFSRREVVEHCQKNIVGYQEPDGIFLSSTIGLVLHPDSVTSIGRRTFRKAGIAQANIHRLRARFAVRAIETPCKNVGSSELRFHRVNAPTSKELNALVATISERVARYLERRGRPARDG
ncbi:hypothetical protein OAM69_01405 [bacterium]|nr:hypothetical protein [bacterium]